MIARFILGDLAKNTFCGRLFAHTNSPGPYEELSERKSLSCNRTTGRYSSIRPTERRDAALFVLDEMFALQSFKHKEDRRAVFSKAERSVMEHVDDNSRIMIKPGFRRSSTVHADECRCSPSNSGFNRRDRHRRTRISSPLPVWNASFGNNTAWRLLNKRS